MGTRQGLLVVGVIGSLFAARSQAQLTTYSDSADNATYTSSFATGQNGGSGFSGWNQLQSSGGGLYLENGGGQVPTSGTGRSWGVFGGSGGYGVGRAFSNAAAVGSITLVARHNVANASFSGFNLKSGNGTGFGSDSAELLSFGLTSATNNSVFVGGSTNTSAGTGSELRGAVMNYTVSWNTILATYTVSANRNGSFYGSASGSLKNTTSSTTVALFGAGNFNAAANQNLIFNNVTVSIPEPAYRSTVLPASGSNQGAINFSSTGRPSQLTLATPVNQGYVAVNGLGSNESFTGVAFKLNLTGGATLGNALALLNSRATPNGYTVTDVAPTWVSRLPSGGSAFASTSLFLTLPAASTGSPTYAYWDFSSLPGTTVAAVAVVPEPTTFGLIAAGLAMLGRRRRR